MTACWLSLLLSLAAPQLANGPLSVTVTNITEQGTIYLAVYRSDDDFGNPKSMYKGYTFPPRSGTDRTTFEIGDLPAGEYGIAIFQDVDSDGELDSNLFGFPTEPYAFSRNVKPRFSPPAFDDCKFTYSGEAKTLTIKLL